MKKLLGLLSFILFLLMLCCKSSIAQTNATGFTKVYDTTSFSVGFGTVYKNFATPTLPNDAVVTAMYPVLQINGRFDHTFLLAQYGTNLFPTSVTGDGSSFCGSGTTCSKPSAGTTFADTEMYGSSIGTSLALLSTYGIQSGLWNTLTNNNITDQINVTGAAIAIYYTSAHPHVDNLLGAPKSISSGTGVAWAVPTVIDALGVHNGGTCIFCSGNGESEGTLGRATPYGYVSLGGIIQIPDAVNFNGTMTVSFQKLNVKNICNAPYLNVPNLNIQYKVVNGVPVGLSSGNYISQDCLSIRAPYYVQLYNNDHKLVSADNWYVPNVASGIVDIGDMQESKFNGPIQVAIPQAIISTPIGSQTITQPFGTSLDIYGTVNFHGTVGYTSTPSFTVMQATQVLVNGVTSSTYAVDANGIINASTGFCVAGCSGLTDGMTLVYSSTSHAYVPGNASVTFPNLYNQTIYSGVTPFAQRAAVNFDNNVFALQDSISPSQTKVTLQQIVQSGTYTDLSSITIDSFGRIHSVGASTTNPPGTITFSGFTAVWDSTYVFSTSYPTTIANTSVAVCSPQSPLPNDINVTCYASGSTVYAKIQNVSGNSTGTVFIPTNTINFRIQR